MIDRRFALRFRAVLNAAVLALCTVMVAAPAMAQAADSYRAGERSDPAGDGSIVYDETDGSAIRLVDVTKVHVAYDAGVGALDIRFDGKGLYGIHKSSVGLSLVVSAPSNGTCDGRLRPGDLTVEASEAARLYGGPEGHRYARLSAAGAGLVADGSLAFNDDVDVRISFVSPYLLRRDYRCVSGLVASKAQQYYSGSSTDSVADFCLAGCPPDRPVAPTLARSGNTLTWNKIANYTSYVVATSLAPEGSGGRNTTYKTVSGTSHTPPAAPGTTRYYGVRVDTPGSPWATEVAITYPPPTAAVVEAPKLFKTGNTLVWGKVGNYTSYVIATSSAPEGSHGRNTTYKTVSGTSYAPPAVPGATRYYGVRVDTPNSLWANPEVAIRYSEDVRDDRTDSDGNGRGQSQRQRGA